MLLEVPGCSFPSAASVVAGFVFVTKPIVRLADVVGLSLKVVLRDGCGLELFLALRLASDRSLGWTEYC